MHVLLTGSTGRIGSAILTSLLTIHPHITHVTTITRRPLDLPSTSTPSTVKHTNLQLTAFHTWPTSILSQIKDADAMIWALGANNADEDVNFNFPSTFCREFLAYRRSSSSSPPSSSMSHRNPFQFIFISGALASTSQTATLYFLPAARKIKGRIEAFALDFAAEHPEEWITWVVRLGGVYRRGTWEEYVSLGFTSMLPRVCGEEVGAFLGDLVKEGGEGGGRVLNERVVERGREVLRERVER